MPDRILRDELLTSERYWSVSPEARNLYVSILLSADDTGRYTGATFALRTKCMAGTVNHERIDALLSELIDKDLVRAYQHDGARYLFVPRFRQRLRYEHSRYPSPPNGISDLPEIKTDPSPSQDRPKSAEEKRREELPPRKSAKPADSGLELRRMVWGSYCESYRQRYNIDPSDSAEARSAIKRFCALVPAEDACNVAAFFLSHSSSFYVEKGHNPKLLAADAAKLRTECLTGRTVTRQSAIQADKLATRGNIAKELIDEFEQKRPKR